MKGYEFDYEIKHFSNRSSEVSNPQTRSLSIIVGFNALFQATDYNYVNIKKIKNDKDLFKSVNRYMVSKRISMKNVVFFPLYLGRDGRLVPERSVTGDAGLAGFCFLLKRDLRKEYSVVKITKSVVGTIFKDTLIDIEKYNSFLFDDVWLIVVSKPHGRNFVVYGRHYIDEKLEEIELLLKKGVSL